VRCLLRATLAFRRAARAAARTPPPPLRQRVKMFLLRIAIARHGGSKECARAAIMKKTEEAMKKYQRSAKLKYQ